MEENKTKIFRVDDHTVTYFKDGPTTISVDTDPCKGAISFMFLSTKSRDNDFDSIDQQRAEKDFREMHNRWILED